MTFKPMKGDDADLSRLVFPYMLSPKLDGHRCLVKDGVALTSSLMREIDAVAKALAVVQH